MHLRTYLLKQKGFADAHENKVYFTDRGLYQEPQGEEFWIFLDEGLRCGGTARKIPCTKAAIGEVLLGCGKKELWEIVQQGIALWENTASDE